MSSKTILLLIGAAIIALLIAAFQYFFKAKRSGNENILFAFLRFLSVFLILVLLINPTINVVSTTLEKPELIILADQSSSIKYLKQEQNLQSVLKQIKGDKELNDQFDVFVYGFGDKLVDSISSTNSSQTKISDALTNIHKVHRKANTATVLLTDGNQTYGSDYSYFKSLKNQSIYAIPFGDTTKVEDVKVTRVNANKYAYLNNTFPVEIQVNYSGEKTKTIQLKVFKEKQLVYKELISFSENKKSHFTNVKIKANSPAGVHTYSAIATPFEGEKNINNNEKSFVVETIDQKTSVLLVSEISHPDISALKRSVESNKRRELVVKKPNQIKDLEKYQMLVLYQPKSSFKKVYDLIEKSKIQTLTITGTQTDWSFLNRLKKNYKKSSFRQVEEILPILNEQFEIFTTNEFSFSKFPPLENSLGSETLSGNFETLLSKKIQGVETSQPLLAFWTENSLTDAVLFGEGIWKWRINDYKNNESFENFDTFFGKVIQFLSNKEKRKRLTVNYESVYYSNNLIKITSNFFNKNYEFDANAKLTIAITSADKSINKKVPMVLKGQFFEADLSDLAANKYNFTVLVDKYNGKVSGNFTVLDFDIEKQFYNADVESLTKLVNLNNGQLFYPEETKSLFGNLLKSDNLKPIQNSKKNQKSLISWKYLLAILIGLLGLEWFLRKYKGLI